MLAPMLIMFREGVEAALIVGIIAAYLRKSGHRRMIRPMWLGIVAATVLMVLIGFTLQMTRSEFPQRQQELFSAVISFVAVGVLTGMIFWMRRAGRSIKSALEEKVDLVTGSTGSAGMTGSWALVTMAFFAVAREGLETVVFLLATFQQGFGWQAPVGAAIGYALAIGVGTALYFGAMHLDLRRFFTYTGMFVIVVAAGLAANGVQALHEAGVWNGLQAQLWSTHAIVSESSSFGMALRGLLGYNDSPTIGEVIVYFAYLVPTMTLFVFGGRATRPAAAKSTEQPRVETSTAT